MIHRQDITILRPLRSASTLLLLLALGGCGSQIDSIDTPDTRPTSPAPAGIYEGTLFSAQRNESLDVIAFLDGEQNRVFAFTEDGELVIGGLYQATSPGISWTAKQFRQVTTTVEDEEGEEVTVPSTEITTLQAQGNFDPEVSMQLSYSASSNNPANDPDIGSLVLSYSKLRYEQRSNLADMLAGEWGIKDEFGFRLSSFTITNDGSVSGTDEDDCRYQGKFSIIDLKYNLYRLTLTQTCGNTAVSGDGLATLNQTPGQPQTILGVVASTNNAAVFLLDQF